MCKLACVRVNAPYFGVLRVFRKDFDQRTSLQCLSDPPDLEPSREFAPKLSHSLRERHFELTGHAAVPQDIRKEQEAP